MTAVEDWTVMADTNQTLLAVVVGALLAAAVLVGTGMVGGGGGGASVAGQQDGITVSASGEASAEPDKAVLSVAVEATRDNPSDARIDVANDVATMLQALGTAGVSDDQIKTTSFEIGEEIRRPPRPGETGEREEPRYHATHRFEMELNDTGSVGSVIDTAVDNGADRVDDVRLTLRDDTRREVRDAALQQAMGHARDQADTLASEAELSITGVGSVSTTDTGVSPVRYDRALAATAEDAAGAGTSIESGPVTVNANVNVVYETG